MVLKQNVEQLAKLKLKAMAECYERQITDPSVRDWSFDERFAQIVDAQLHDNEQRRLQRFLRNAKLRISTACIEDLNLNPARGMDKSYMANLNTLQWVDCHQNLLIDGATGTGKTYLACAYAMECIRRGLPALYKRLSRLMEEMALAQALGTKEKLMTQLQKPKLLILDDWGLPQITEQYAGFIFDIVEQRDGLGSIVITSQLPRDIWFEYLNQPTLADSILDRLTSDAHEISLKGDSMRPKRQHSMQENTHV